MATYSYHFLSGGSADGRGIEVAATATPGTLIHTSHATATDEIYLDAVVTGGTDRTLVIEFGGVTDADDLITVDLKAGEGLVRVVAGLPLTGGIIVRAFCAAAADEINIFGKVHRIT